MKVLVVGRLAARVDAVVSAVRGHGRDAVGVTTDSEAFAQLDTGEIALLVIGGGVEPDSRAALKRRAADHDTQILEKAMGPRGPAGYAEREILPRLAGWGG